ncbi:fetal alzheimer falz [Vairimorpha apis BRL 01]|uniref:Fetal alzheimer falz n=1 Tax=Vairimorpha apis BRL 01 TaxID=1037528 RepID=T0MBF3_9MICR|nr:fetal alzheimer falz [Vairimorpha apis BRL 01]
MNINKDRRGRDECLNGFIELMMGILRNDPNSWPFLDPVSAKDIPEYYEIIKSPMDLSKIREKFRNNIYKSLDLFISDVHLMLNNCFKFNARETQYYRCAEVLFTLFEEKLKFYENSIKYWEF